MDLQGPGRPLVILDEIHKYCQWKNYLKGVYDKFSSRFVFGVLGSGRLDFAKRSGDSLAGRFFEMHLFPFTAAELSAAQPDFKKFIRDPFGGMDLVDSNLSASVWEQLFHLSGFPEPFLSGKEEQWRRWSASYGKQIIREDMRSVSEIKRVDDIELLFSLLPLRVGSPVSMNNLARELQVSFPAVKNWLSLFDHFYLTFRISPWTKKCPVRFCRRRNYTCLTIL